MTSSAVTSYSNYSDTDEEIIVNGRFVVGEKIGSGSFGDTYLGYDKINKTEVAIKMESRGSKHKQLSHEYKVLENLKGCEGLPRSYWFCHEGGYNILVMELLGPNLEQLFERCNRKFSLKTVLMLADTILKRLESIHQHNYIHRDVKPENLLVGCKANDISKVFLIDFGLAKCYRNACTKEHIFYVDGKSLTGTARYASINAHMGIELSRRDDLEEMALVLLYLLRGSLPWQGMYGQNKQEKFKRILESKTSKSVTQMCRDLPGEFGKLLHYARSLRFHEEPDYRYVRRMFRELFRRRGFESDGGFDWVLLSRLKDCQSGGLKQIRIDESKSRRSAGGKQRFL